MNADGDGLSGGHPVQRIEPEQYVGHARPLTPADVIRLRQGKRLAREAWTYAETFNRHRSYPRLPTRH
jgi:hypothetical protein